MLLAKHPHRWLYFWGRIASFSLAALLAAEVGLLFSSSYFSLAVGTSICMMGIFLLFHLSLPTSKRVSKPLARIGALVSKLILINHPMATFLFGFCTVLLPCGQSLIVFSACALAPSAWIGFFNGFLFALCTSPSLVLAMYASTLFRRWQDKYRFIMGGMTLFIGLLALLRGFANLDLIPHLTLPHHIVLY